MCINLLSGGIAAVDRAPCSTAMHPAEEWFLAVESDYSDWERVPEMVITANILFYCNPRGLGKSHPPALYFWQVRSRVCAKPAGMFKRSGREQMHAQKAQGWSTLLEKPHKSTPPCTVWGTDRAAHPERNRSGGDRQPGLALQHRGYINPPVACSWGSWAHTGALRQAASARLTAQMGTQRQKLFSNCLTSLYITYGHKTFHSNLPSAKYHLNIPATAPIQLQASSLNTISFPPFHTSS